MKLKLKFVAALALSLPAVFGGPASAAVGGRQEEPVKPVQDALNADDPVHATLAGAALELERRTGIADPSAPSG